MRYQAIIHFEVKDENVDLTDLIEEQKINCQGLDLIGRTDEEEVASELKMMWGGVVRKRPEAKVKIGEATKEIRRRLEVDEETAELLCDWMSYVYGYMASQGLCPPAPIGPCASSPGRWSSSGAERLLCLNGRTEALARATARGTGSTQVKTAHRAKRQ